MSENNMVFKLELGKHSAPGVNRPQNDDNVGYYLPPQPAVLHLRGQMFIIADGDTDDQQGYIASKLAVETLLQEYYDAPWSGIPQEMLAKAIEKANKKLFEISAEEGGSFRVTSSLSCVVIINEMLYLVHVGKCRVYLLGSDQNLEQLTQDQAGEGASPYQFSPYADLNELPRKIGPALGIDANLRIEVITRKIQISDIILLCSDGIYGSLQDSVLHEILTTSTPQDACELIVNSALENQTQQDATALIIKLKSIRRIAGDDKEEAVEEEPEQPADRQIVIKGVRYRSTWKDDQLPSPENRSVEEFDQDRDVRRPIGKRKSPAEKIKLPSKNVLNVFAFIVLIVAIIFLIIKYGPALWQTSPPAPQTTTTPDSLTVAPVIEPDTVVASQEFEPQPPVTQKIEQEPPVTEKVELDIPNVPLKVAVVNGSYSNKLKLSSIVKDLKVLAESDQITPVKSTIKIPKSKIIWRRTNDAAKAAAIQERVNQYKRLILQNYQIEALTQPLDFTLVIGANFKLPNLGIAKGETNQGKKYYLEILNGSTASGMARKLGTLLDNRSFGGNTLNVIDYRNADKKNYRTTFLKCKDSQNEIAGSLISAMKLPNYVINEPLFDVKLLIGTDID